MRVSRASARANEKEGGEGVARRDGRAKGKGYMNSDGGHTVREMGRKKQKCRAGHGGGEKQARRRRAHRRQNRLDAEETTGGGRNVCTAGGIVRHKLAKHLNQTRIRLDGKRTLRTRGQSQLTSRQAQRLASDETASQKNSRKPATSKHTRLFCPDVVKCLAADGTAAHRPRDVLGKAFAVLAQVVGGVWGGWTTRVPGELIDRRKDKPPTRGETRLERIHRPRTQESKETHPC